MKCRQACIKCKHTILILKPGSIVHCTVSLVSIFQLLCTIIFWSFWGILNMQCQTINVTKSLYHQSYLLNSWQLFQLPLLQLDKIFTRHLAHNIKTCNLFPVWFQVANFTTPMPFVKDRWTWTGPELIWNYLYLSVREGDGGEFSKSQVDL